MHVKTEAAPTCCSGQPRFIRNYFVLSERECSFTESPGAGRSLREAWMIIESCKCDLSLVEQAANMGCRSKMN